MKRPKPKRVRAVVRIDSTTDTEVVTLARVRARTTDDALRLARHLAYQRRADRLEVWTWTSPKRRQHQHQSRSAHARVRTRARARFGSRTGTCTHHLYEREHFTGKKLVLTDRRRVSQNRVPKLPTRGEART